MNETLYITAHLFGEKLTCGIKEVSRLSYKHTPNYWKHKQRGHKKRGYFVFIVSDDGKERVQSAMRFRTIKKACKAFGTISLMAAKMVKRGLGLKETNEAIRNWLLDLDHRHWDIGCKDEFPSWYDEIEEFRAD